MTSVWLVEHHFRSEWSHSSAPDITLAALSQRTVNMRLGIAVVLAPLHHPLNIASRMATLDIISGGRVNLGLGRSGYPYQMLPLRLRPGRCLHNAGGIPANHPRRLDRRDLLLRRPALPNPAPRSHPQAGAETHILPSGRP